MWAQCPASEVCVQVRQDELRSQPDVMKRNVQKSHEVLLADIFLNVLIPHHGHAVIVRQVISQLKDLTNLENQSLKPRP